MSLCLACKNCWSLKGPLFIIYKYSRGYQDTYIYIYTLKRLTSGPQTHGSSAAVVRPLLPCCRPPLSAHSRRWHSLMSQTSTTLPWQGKAFAWNLPKYSKALRKPSGKKLPDRRFYLCKVARDSGRHHGSSWWGELCRWTSTTKGRCRYQASKNAVVNANEMNFLASGSFFRQIFVSMHSRSESKPSFLKACWQIKRSLQERAQLHPLNPCLMQFSREVPFSSLYDACHLFGIGGLILKNRYCMFN